MSAVSLGLRTVIGCLLMVAGVAKLGGATETAGTLAQYGVLPSSLRPTVARLLPVAEIVLAVTLLAGFEVAVTGVCTGTLFLGFAATMSRSLARGDVFDCGCGLGRSSPISWTRVLLDVVLAGTCLLVALSPNALTVNRVNDTADVIHYLPVPLIALMGLAVARLSADVRESSTTIYRAMRYRLARRRGQGKIRQRGA